MYSNGYAFLTPITDYVHYECMNKALVREMCPWHLMFVLEKTLSVCYGRENVHSPLFWWERSKDCKGNCEPSLAMVILCNLSMFSTCPFLYFTVNPFVLHFCCPVFVLKLLF